GEPRRAGAADPGAAPGDAGHDPPSAYASAVLSVLDARGPSFAQELERGSELLASHFEMGLAELMARGLVTCDTFGGLRRLLTPPSRRPGPARRARFVPGGRWSRFRPGRAEPEGRAPSLVP